jgi:hypothetical protein
MKEEGLSFGAGDFAGILNQLTNGQSHLCKDILNKLFLVKYGSIFKKGVLPDLLDPDSKVESLKLIEEEPDCKMRLYRDTTDVYDQGRINRKKVRKIYLQLHL